MKATSLALGLRQGHRMSAICQQLNICFKLVIAAFFRDVNMRSCNQTRIIVETARSDGDSFTTQLLEQ